MKTCNQCSLTRNLILVLLPAVILLASILLSVAVTWAADASQPQLRILDNIPRGPASVVQAPVVLTATSQRVSGIAFPIDFDERCLTFDATDADGNGIPDAVQFTAQPGFRGSVSLRPNDPDAELIFILADYSPPIATLEAGAVVTITFTTRCTPPPGSTIYAPVRFAELPRTTFGSPEGRSVAGSTLHGGVIIGDRPFIEPTATPTSSPPPTPTGAPPSPTPLVTPLVTPTAAASPTPTPSPTPSPTPTAIVGGNAAPETRFDPAGVLQGEPVTIDVLANDRDLDGDPLTISAVAQPASGAAAVIAGKVVYTPATTYAGFESFTYIVRDPHDSPGLGRAGVVVSSVRNHGFAPAMLVANDSRAVTAVVGIEPTVVELTLPPHVYPGLLAGDEVFYLAYLNWQRPAANINVAGDGLRYLERGFTLQAYVNDRAAAAVTLAQPLQLTWRYSAPELAGVDEQSMTLLRWDALAGAWSTAGIGAGAHNSQAQHLTFTVTRPGEYAFFGRTRAPFTRYLPFVQHGAADAANPVRSSRYLPLINHQAELWEGATDRSDVLAPTGEPGS